MSDLSDGDFDHDYDPSQEDSDDSEVSCESEVSSGSDDDVDEGVKPIIDEGWSYLSDSFTDARQTPPPLFHGVTPVSRPQKLVPRLRRPKMLLCPFLTTMWFYAMCTWMNERADKYLTYKKRGKETGKRRLSHGLFQPTNPPSLPSKPIIGM